MRVLVVSATAFEIRPFLEKLHLAGKKSDQLSCYQYKQVSIDVLIPGVGMVATAYYLGKQFAIQPYDLAINAGIAGTFNRDLALGSVVNVVEDCIPELGAENGENFLSMFELGLADPDQPPYRGGKLVIEPITDQGMYGIEIITKLPRVKGITSNTVRGNLRSIARIRQLADADLESMEGAAFFYACLTAAIPCLQIRAISNLVEERDKSSWKLDLALKNLNRLLRDLLNSIPPAR